MQKKKMVINIFLCNFFKMFLKLQALYLTLKVILNVHLIVLFEKKKKTFLSKIQSGTLFQDAIFYPMHYYVSHLFI